MDETLMPDTAGKMVWLKKRVGIKRYLETPSVMARTTVPRRPRGAALTQSPLFPWRLCGRWCPYVVAVWVEKRSARFEVAIEWHGWGRLSQNKNETYQHRQE
jgi:hypothetical protein